VGDPADESSFLVHFSPKSGQHDLDSSGEDNGHSPLEEKHNTVVGTQKWNCFAQPRLIRDKSYTKR